MYSTFRRTGPSFHLFAPDSARIAAFKTSRTRSFRRRRFPHVSMEKSRWGYIPLSSSVNEGINFERWNAMMGIGFSNHFANFLIFSLKSDFKIKHQSFSAKNIKDNRHLSHRRSLVSGLYISGTKTKFMELIGSSLISMQNLTLPRM